MMNAKEKQRMKRLEIENGMLRLEHAKFIRSYGDVLMENIELKAKLELIESAIRGSE